MQIKKRICLVIPSLQAGGMERVMSELANYFAGKKELEVHLVLYGIKRELFYDIADTIQIHIPGFVFNNRFRLFYTIRTLFFLRKKVKSIQPESILSFGEYWNNFVLLSLLGLKYPVYVSDRSQPDKPLGRLHDFLRRKLYPGAKGVIAQTERAKEYFQQLYHHPNIIVIGNPIRQIHVDGEARENIILMVGRLIRSKNQDQLIEIFASINRPGWKLVLVGYDHLKQNNQERLEALTKVLGVADHVVFAGKQDNVDQYYMKSKIFAFTSSSEGFPNVIGEAMSAGLPVVAYDCMAGPSDLIDHGENGFLIPLMDKELFAKKLALVMEDENLQKQMSDSAKRGIEKFYAPAICQQFLKFITEESTETGVLKN